MLLRLANSPTRSSCIPSWPKPSSSPRNPAWRSDLARALGKVPKKRRPFENDEYVISSAVGHVGRARDARRHRQKKYGFWRLETLPIIPEKFGLKPIERYEGSVQPAQKTLRRKDVDAVINACDAGREGELIFENIYRLSKIKEAGQARLAAIDDAGVDPRSVSNTCDGEQMAAGRRRRSRSESDWLVGINGTRAITKRIIGRGLATSPPSAACKPRRSRSSVDREQKIRNFEPRDYWRVTAKFQVEEGSYEGV